MELTACPETQHSAIAPAGRHSGGACICFALSRAASALHAPASPGSLHLLSRRLFAIPAGPVCGPLAPLPPPVTSLSQPPACQRLAMQTLLVLPRLVGSPCHIFLGSNLAGSQAPHLSDNQGQGPEQHDDINALRLPSPRKKERCASLPLPLRRRF